MSAPLSSHKSRVTYVVGCRPEHHSEAHTVLISFSPLWPHKVRPWADLLPHLQSHCFVQLHMAARGLFCPNTDSRVLLPSQCPASWLAMFAATPCVQWGWPDTSSLDGELLQNTKKFCNFSILAAQHSSGWQQVLKWLPLDSKVNERQMIQLSFLCYHPNPFCVLVSLKIPVSSIAKPSFIPLWWQSIQAMWSYFANLDLGRH